MSMGPGLWEDHAQRDIHNSQLVGLDGEVHTYKDLLEFAKTRSDLVGQIQNDVYQDKHDRAQHGLAQISEALNDVSPDVVVIIGDDQHELFGSSGVPAIGIFTGESVCDEPTPPDRLAQLSEGMRRARWTSHAEEHREHRVHSLLARHIVAELSSHDFDVTQVARQPFGSTIGHAFNFVRYRLHLGVEVPMVPVLLNTYIAPNVISPIRSYRLGQALRRAIESFDEQLDVVVIGSGGLSHFVVLEEFDRAVLSALKTRDVSSIARLSRRYFRSGTSEVLNWIAAGGALELLDMEVIDYIPGYRSLAGTGTGMAFAIWR